MVTYVVPALAFLWRKKKGFLITRSDSQTRDGAIFVRFLTDKVENNVVKKCEKNMLLFEVQVTNKIILLIQD